MCCTRLAENTGHKKSSFWHHRTTLLGCIFASEACIDNRKNLLNIDTSSTCPHNMVKVNFAALCNRGPLYFCPVVSFFLLLSSFFLFFSSPNLSRRRLDVCHTSTHGVALVRISDAGLKPAGRGSLKTQDAKKSPKIAIWAPSHNFVGPYLRKEDIYRQ